MNTTRTACLPAPKALRHRLDLAAARKGTSLKYDYSGNGPAPYTIWSLNDADQEQDLLGNGRTEAAAVAAAIVALGG